METFKFMLPSGLQAEVGEIVGEHIDTITKPRSRTEHPAVGITHVLADITKQIGSDNLRTMLEKERFEYIGRLLPADFMALYVYARQFTFGFPETFDFKATVKDEADKEHVLEFTEEIKDGLFPIKYADCAKAIGALEKLEQDSSFTGITDLGYKSLPTTYAVEVTHRKKPYKFTLSYVTNDAAMRFNDGKVTTMVQARKPLDTETNFTIQTRKVASPILTGLLKAIGENEGQVFTTATFKNPYTGADESVDLTFTEDFLL